MQEINIKELSAVKMSSKIPECVAAADNQVICKGIVKKWIWMGWMTVREANDSDYDSIPKVIGL